MISPSGKAHTRKAIFFFCKGLKVSRVSVTWGWITRRGFARMTHVSFLLRVTPESRGIKYKIVVGNTDLDAFVSRYRTE